jgi:serine/threonine-protein kinase RsbT
MNRDIVGTPQHLAIRHASDAVVARRYVREMGQHIGLTDTDIAALATAVTEIVRNIVVYAGNGELSIRALTAPARRGVVVTATDRGPGIADIAAAMNDGHSTGSGLGLGLPSARRLVHEFEIHSALESGTTVTLRQWSSDEAPLRTGRRQT